MHISTYLMLSRHNVFYFRWPIPKALHPYNKCTHIRVSLDTRDNRLAMQLSRWLSYWADELLSSVANKNMKYHEIRTLLKSHFASLLEQRKSSMADKGRLSGLELNVLRSSILTSDAPEIFNHTANDEKPPVDRLIALYGLPVSQGSDTYKTMETEFRSSYKAYCQHVLDYDKSMEEYDLSSAAEPSRSPSSSEGMDTPLSELVRRFVEERVRGDNWTKKSEKEYRAIFNLLLAILGTDIACTAINSKSAQKVKSTLQQVPKNINSNPKTRGLTFEDAITVVGVERMHVKTINKHLNACHGLFKWAEKNGYVSKNVFTGLTIKLKKSGDGERTAFSKDQIGKILSAILKDETSAIKKEYQRWGPLIAIYSGARLNEIAQLQLGDVRQVDGLWCFDINEKADGVRLKTSSATRLIPIHSELLELGFLEHVERLMKAGKQRLLHELSLSQGTGYGRNLSRWFNGPFLKAVDMSGQGLVFHSFRHTMVTNLLQSGVAEPLVKAIVGHAQEGVTQQVYFGDGYTVAQKKSALEMLKWK